MNAVTRNNVTVSLIDALAAVFPATQRITGVEFFRAMARFHVRATPPRSPLLFEYGHEFPEFIERYEYARPMPYLADTARIERAWLDAYHAADMLPLSADNLALIPPELLADVVFVPHPATRIVRSQFPALSIFVANRGRGPVERIETFIPEDTLVTRPDQQVTMWRVLPSGCVTSASESQVLAARWQSLEATTKDAEAETSADLHVVKIVLRSMNIRLTVGGSTVLDGVATPGTFHVTPPVARVRATFRGAYDALHLFVPDPDPRP